MTEEIHVVLAFDDNFWAPAFALLRSICLSTKRRDRLVFHLLHLPLSSDHRRDISKISEEFGARIEWYELENSATFLAFVADLPASGQWPKVVYARLLIGELLAENIARAIYLDCDMLVRQPIEQLYEADLMGKPLGAVPDSLTPFIMGRRDMRQNVGIFDLADPYFNSGMLLVDLAKWRSFDMRAEISHIVAQGWLPKLYYDQDILNIVFRGKWHPIEWRWNTIDAHPAHEGLNPAILHYTGVNKPWGILAGILRSSAYARWYRHVMTNELFYRFARHRWKRWWSKRLDLRNWFKRPGQRPR